MLRERASRRESLWHPADAQVPEQCGTVERLSATGALLGLDVVTCQGSDADAPRGSRLWSRVPMVPRVARFGE